MTSGKDAERPDLRGARARSCCASLAGHEWTASFILSAAESCCRLMSSVMIRFVRVKRLVWEFPCGAGNPALSLQRLGLLL